MKQLVLLLLSTVLFLGSCCDPKPRNSYPSVIDSSYSFESVKDATIPVPPDYVLDSAYYPIYSLDIKNTGSESDTFTVIIDRDQGGNVLFDKQYVEAGQTKSFHTYGPIPSNALDTAKYRYYSFFTSTPDSLDLKVLRPSVRIYYGSSLDGPETCGMAATSLTVKVDSLGKN